MIVIVVAVFVVGRELFPDRGTSLINAPSADTNAPSAETCVEGNFISPKGMTLSNEVWIVIDFRALATGIADDLAKARVPLQQEIEERQDHVQRAQADIASREERIRLIQAEIQTSKTTDTSTKIEDLQQRIKNTEAEEVPLKVELQQAQADLAQALSADAGLDAKYYKQLHSLPAEAIIKRIPFTENGHFNWRDDAFFAEGEKERHYWIFACATRPDGREYWALRQFSMSKNQSLELNIKPSDFVSTKAILRPDLSSDEQEQ